MAHTETTPQTINTLTPQQRTQRRDDLAHNVDTPHTQRLRNTVTTHPRWESIQTGAYTYRDLALMPDLYNLIRLTYTNDTLRTDPMRHRLKQTIVDYAHARFDQLDFPAASSLVMSTITTQKDDDADYEGVLRFLDADSYRHVTDLTLSAIDADHPYHVDTPDPIDPHTAPLARLLLSDARMHLSTIYGPAYTYDDIVSQPSRRETMRRLYPTPYVDTDIAAYRKHTLLSTRPDHYPPDAQLRAVTTPGGSHGFCIHYADGTATSLVAFCPIA